MPATSLIPKSSLGIQVTEALASCDGKPGLPGPNSQAGAWELAQLGVFRGKGKHDNVENI